MDSVTEERKARSWSQYSSFRQCPKAFELERHRKVPSRPGPWLAAGTAVHMAIEMYLRLKVQEGT